MQPDDTFERLRDRLVGCLNVKSEVNGIGRKIEKEDIRLWKANPS
jgi:hypothetical protein